jgi:hypothetical protein
MGPSHYFVVRCKGTFEEFRYQVVTFFGSGKAIFMAASAHSQLHPTENVSEVAVQDQGPVPDGDGFLGEDWMIDRYEY